MQTNALQDSVVILGQTDARTDKQTATHHAKSATTAAAVTEFILVTTVSNYASI